MQQRVSIELSHILCACAYNSTRYQLNSQAFLVIYFGMPNMQLKQRTECPKIHTVIQQNHWYFVQDKEVQCQQQDGGNYYP